MLKLLMCNLKNTFTLNMYHANNFNFTKIRQYYEI